MARGDMADTRETDEGQRRRSSEAVKLLEVKGIAIIVIIIIVVNLVRMRNTLSLIVRPMVTVG